jgi:phage terminase large subunit GpA-like protein
MRNNARAALAAVVAPQSRQTPWQWACDNIDFSQAPEYESSARGKFDPAYMPFMEEPLNAIADPECREIIFLKCSRAGGSENLLLMPIRYSVAVNPLPIIYASAQQESTEDFFEERIIGGLKCSRQTADALAHSRRRGNVLYLGNGCHIVATWSKSISGFKQRGAGLCLADEVSSWPDYGRLDMLRKRMDTFSFPHLVIVSSPDPGQSRPSSEDPIFKEFDTSDQRYWFMWCPKTRKPFRFEMGSPDTTHGLKWDIAALRDDGTWDLDRVAKTSVYVTPGGAVITNERRRDLIARGRWMPTNASAARHGKRGYHLNQFYVPFASGDFGNIAVRFLESNAKGKQSLRVFVYETLAEKWKDEVERATDEILIKRCAGYTKGAIVDTLEPWKTTHAKLGPQTIISVDVQKHELYWLARRWFENGDSFLIDWGVTSLWDTIDEAAKKYDASKVLVDNSYEGRKVEVERECAERLMIPIFGRELRDSRAIIRRKIEVPLRGATVPIASYTFNPDEFGLMLLSMMRGECREKWNIYDLPEREYILQVTAEELVNGAWVKKRRNHLLDCERYNILGAVLAGCYQSSSPVMQQ